MINLKTEKIHIKCSDWVWTLFQAIQISIIGLMTWSLLSEDWLKLGFSGQYYDLRWTGSLNSVHKGLGGLKGTSYSDLFKAYCSRSDLSQDIQINESTWCKMFASLWVSEIVYVLFEVVAMLLMVSWTISLRLALKTNKLRRVPGICSANGAWVLHVAGFITWMVLSRANFSGDCNKESDGKSPPKLCALTGPTIALALAIIMPILAISYPFLIRCLTKSVETQSAIPKQPEGKMIEVTV
ncbi:unnamed protein product [Blepharisma stoltei]|uniref:Uncharacterized protein n=1 Tax=Blepharisma stoltei TaxID=1481888 RepID=A0AAU9JYL1_9CILI|nr:unnamed protein product [Blepharisma stoltei]